MNATSFSLSFSVGFDDGRGGEYACDWNWPFKDGKPTREWTLSKKDGAAWCCLGSLDEGGRIALLLAFGLMGTEECYPLETLRRYSPSTLMECRRRLEERSPHLRFLHVVSDRMGDRIQAELVQ